MVLCAGHMDQTIKRSKGLFTSRQSKFEGEIFFISRNGQYKDVYSRTIEIPQRTRIFKAYSFLKGSQCTLKVSTGKFRHKLMCTSCRANK